MKNVLKIYVVGLLILAGLFGNEAQLQAAVGRSLFTVNHSAPVSVPVNSVVPAISGASPPQVGSALTSSTGTWSNSPTGYTYQWKSNCSTNITGATTSSYTPVSGDVGNTLCVVVVASNGVGGGSPATSSATSAVITVSAPTNSVLPVISGLSPPQVASALTTTTGTWGNSPTGFAYQWKSAGTNVGTNANAYTPVTGDIGNAITVVVTASNGGGSTPATSSATSAVIANSGSVTFTALHTYFLSPTGSGSTCSQASPCANTMAHATVCGDAWIALNGTTYNPANFDPTETFTEEWNTPTSCPSTTGGIDGTGGINEVPLLCQTYLGCSFTITAGTSKYDMFVDQPHWSIQGWDFSNPTGDGNGGCAATGAVNGSSTPTAYVSFINNRAANCPLIGIGSGGFPGQNFGADEQVFIGNIIFNAAQGASECGSGMPLNVPANFDAASGTHVYIVYNYIYGNINGVCGANSNGQGNYTTASSAATAGASTITLANTTKATAGWPIIAYSNSSLVAPTAAIPFGTLSTGVTSGTTIGLSHNVVSPGVSSGQNIAVGTSTDGEGINFDTWQLNSYTGKTRLKSNVVWGNGSSGFEMFCGAGTCSSSLNIGLANMTLYGNLQDYKHDGSGWDVYLNDNSNTFPLSITNSIIQSSVTKPAGSTTNGAIGQGGTGQPVNALATSRSGYTITGNYVYSVPGVACAQFATCNSGNDIAQFNGATYTSGQTFSNPGLTSPGSLPTTLISCSGTTNGTACAVAAGIITDITPTIASTTLGYQSPGACATDADYPTFQIKGLNYLSFDISTGTITENSGLSQKPCGT